MAIKKIELKDFARDVERLCDFLLEKLSKNEGKDDSPDLKIVQDLKDKAADIQYDKVQIVSETLSGLADYMKGANVP